jgi:hypothetical protein
MTPRFPMSAGLLLGAAVCAHLAAVVQVVFGEPTSAATLFLVGQTALAFALIRLIDGDWVFQDIRFLFAIFYFLYGATLPLLVTFGGGNNPGAAAAAFLYATGFVGFNLVQWWHKEPWRDIPPAAFDRIRPNAVNLAIVVFTLGFIIAYAYSRGLRLELSIDRTQLQFVGTQLWAVSQFAMIAGTMFMFAGWARLSRPARIIFGVTVAAYVLIQLSFGNRREFLPIAVFVAGLIAIKRRSVIRLGTAAFGLVAFAFFLAIALVRQIILHPGLLAKGPMQLLLESNEFVAPIQTLMHYATVDRPLKLGWTYLYAPALLIPRAIWPGKPESLSLEFLRDAFGYTALMGYAYTPVTEAFINFSWVGPFIALSAVSLLMVKLVRNADVRPGLYLIAFAMVVDFNRGDSGGMFYTVAVIGAVYAGMSFLSTLKWAGAGARTLRPEGRPPGRPAPVGY